MSPQSVTTSNHAERPCCRWSRLKLSVRNSALVGRTRIGLSAERAPVAESEGSVHFSKTFVIRECITHTISRRSPKSACGSFGTRELFRSRFLSRRLGNVAGALCLRVAARGSHCYRDIEWSKPDSHHYIAWQLTTRRCLSQRGPSWLSRGKAVQIAGCDDALPEATLGECKCFRDKARAFMNNVRDGGEIIEAAFIEAKQRAHEIGSLNVGPMPIRRCTNR